MIAIGFDDHLEQLERGPSSRSSCARALDVALAEAADQLLHLRPDDVGVDADAADAAELEERAGSGRRRPRRGRGRSPRRSCRAWSRSSFACLTAVTFGISASSTIVSGSMLSDDAARDVVDDDRLVGRRGDRLEVLDDPARRRLVVVRRDDEEAVDAELVRALGQVDRVRGRVRARAGDDGRAVRRPRRPRRRRARTAPRR